MNQSLAIVLGIVFFLALVRLNSARNSRDIHLGNAESAKLLQKKEREDIEKSLVQQNTWTMNACAVVLIGIGTFMFIAFLNEEERPPQHDSVATHP